MKIPKLVNKSVLLEAVKKVTEKSSIDQSEEINFAPRRNTLDENELNHTDASFVSYQVYPEDLHLNFLSGDVSMINETGFTPTFQDQQKLKKDFSVEPQEKIECTATTSMKPKSSTAKYWGLSVAVGLLGLIYLGKKSR